VFAKNFDDVNNDELLEYLRQFLIDTKSHQNESIKLKEQITSIKNCIDEIIEEIYDHNLKITKKRENLSNKIDITDKVRNGAISFMIGGATTFGIATTISVAAAATMTIPLTSLTAFVLGAIALGGYINSKKKIFLNNSAATTTVSTVVAGTLSLHNAI
jgi:hypothetical protein